MQRYSCISFLFVSFFALTVVAFADNEECGLINADQFRNSENVTQIDEFPWMARLIYKSTITSERVLRDCLAVLISPQHLLATAYCSEYSEVPYEVVLGDWNTLTYFTDCDEITGKCSTPLLIEIDKVINYPFYSKLRNMHDIIVIRLTKAVTLSDYIRPICLPSKDIRDKQFESKQLAVTGWPPEVDGQKQKSAVFIYNQHDCRLKYGSIKNITDSHICGMAADERDKYMSGSALMDVKGNETHPRSVYLLGLLAHGPRGHLPTYPDIYMRIDQYLDWIKENMF